METFQFENCADPIRPNLIHAYQETWSRISRAGTWLSGAERVAVAEETRRARNCAFCRARKDALSPAAFSGEHDHAGALSDAMVDTIHRVTTDAARLTESWYRSLIDAGITPETYVEMLGVAVQVISVDSFCIAMGCPLEPLPDAMPGEPTRVRPNGLVEGEAWVPILTTSSYVETLPGPGAGSSFVLRALSLVPEEVKAWMVLSDAQYVPMESITQFEQDRSLDRSQIELVAGRVSALNECFY